MHPLRAWRTKKGFDPEKVSALIKKRFSRTVAPRTIEAIELGYRHPGFELADAIAKLINDGTTVADLKRYPLHRSAA